MTGLLLRSRNSRVVSARRWVGKILTPQCLFSLRFECLSLSMRMATLTTSSTLVQARPNQELAALNPVSR